MIIQKLLIPILLFASGNLLAQDFSQVDSSSHKKVFVEDDPVVSMLDSLATLKVFRNSIYQIPGSNQQSPTYSDDQIPYFPDSVYRERITGMSIESPFEYVYNSDVKQFIDLYAYRKRGLTARILGLTQIYFPLFEEQLDKFNMPLELKYLAVIESALNPIANSRAGAKGLWQFMYGTGKVYGLKTTSYVDDRFDPVKSTIAACEHLTDLYDIYGNWSLALAAYNSGAGNVNKAIRRAGGAKNFWVIQRYLPKETRSYVPAFIAASYVLTHAAEHHITAVDPGILFYEIDTVMVKRPLAFDQISEMFNIPYEEIQFLNPSYKQGVIPATAEHPFMLRLRKKHIGNFINNENMLYSYKTRRGIERDSLLAIAYQNSRETIEYKVKAGESISVVAKKFHMSVSELKSLNSLKKNYVKPKQTLLVYASPPRPRPQESNPIAIHPAPDTASRQSHEQVASSAGKTEDAADKSSSSKIKEAKPKNASSSSQKGLTKTGKKQSPKYIIYTVQAGDNLWDIAEKFDGVTVADIKKLNKIKNTQRLQAGQKLKIMPGN